MKILVSIVLAFISISVKAQKVYFLYFQSENNTSFYVKLSDKVYSSSGGYVIISNLLDSTYNISVGNSSLQGTRFIITINGKDRGYLVKNISNGISLIDIETNVPLKPLIDPTKTNVTYETHNDAFTILLSKSASDSSLLKVPVQLKPEIEEKEKAVVNSNNSLGSKETKVKEEVMQQENHSKDVVKTKEIKTDSIVHKDEPSSTSKLTKDTSSGIQNSTVQSISNGEKKKEETKPLTKIPEINKDTVSVVYTAKTQTPTTETQHKDSVFHGSLNKISDEKKIVKEEVSKTTEPIVTDVLYKKSKITKHSESSTSVGFGLVYFDNDGSSIDTIRLLIPNPRIMFDQSENNHPETTGIINKENNQNTVNSEKSSETNTNQLKQNTSVSGSIVPNNDKRLIKPGRPVCKNQANKNDFLKLRKNMASKSSDEDMIYEARKSFRNKCFTTEQIKNLGALFLTASGKYQFFDAAYSHVSDQEQFASLQTEITDDYYARRFKALVGE